MIRVNVLGGLSVVSERHPAGVVIQPRRLAVLAILAVAGERGVTREQILTLLWPDNDEERGRHALTQALYALRKDLGAEDLFLGQQELRLNPDLTSSDWDDFHRAIRAGRPERAIELYGGPFLDRFHPGKSDNFDRWSEDHRSRVEQGLGQALETAAIRATERKDLPAAIAFLRRRSEQDPLDPKVAVKLIEALAAHGDVVNALQYARSYEARVKAELDLPVDAAVLALTNRLRAAARMPAEEPPTAAGAHLADIPGQEAREVHTGPPPASVSRRWRLATVSLLVIISVLLAASYFRPARQTLADTARPVLAVGIISDYGAREGAGLGLALGDMLATNLSRGTGFRVVSTGRMLELTRQIRDHGDSADVVGRAARQAGAAQLIDGSLYTLAPGSYRLDLRRVDLATGAVIRSYKVEGADLFALVDSGTAGLIPDLGGELPAGSVALASTRSLAAYQAYEEGLRKYYDDDLAGAEIHFRRALDFDSNFAQAAFAYARANTSASRTSTFDRMKRALVLSRRANDRDRLVIQAEWAASNLSKSLVPIADTLVIRYPEEIEGYYYAGIGAVMEARYADAERHFLRVLSLDSLELPDRKSGQRCWLCEAYIGLSNVYFSTDSVDKMRRFIRQWVRRQPSNPQPWRGLASVYVAEHQMGPALTALRIADSLDPSNPFNWRFLVSVRAAADDYPEAVRLLRAEVETAPVYFRPQARWDLAVCLRQMGRLDEALQMARQFRSEVQERALPGAAPYNALLEGQVLFELGRYRESAALFDSIAMGQDSTLDPALQAKDRVWAWVHEADALAQLGDTARLRFLADSMEVLGGIVAQARDVHLHQHVRGLLARLEGRPDEAMEWFRRAIVSPVAGFTRSNHELGQLYLKAGRPKAAIGIVRPASHGGTVGSNLYITRTELLLQLARAFEQAGASDSAKYYYQTTARIWNQADARFRPRLDSIEVALARLERQGDATSHVIVP
ncbi:MAG TPA: BTAD domain-containing putative transcriptional regulator [Gemmatimonadales bacterium]|nr:BTAD domain-containing putative transcriptional regulator [Gemmatimonadales bacterium]